MTMKQVLFSIVVCLIALRAHAATYYVIVAGLGGEPNYDQRFTSAANDLDRIFKSAGVTAHVITLKGTQATATQFRDAMNSVASAAMGEDDFVLMLIGHGSFDGVEYKFNLVGHDITAGEIASMCDHIGSRRQLIVDTTSASGGALQALEKPGRAAISTEPDRRAEAFRPVGA